MYIWKDYEENQRGFGKNIPEFGLILDDSGEC